MREMKVLREADVDDAARRAAERLAARAADGGLADVGFGFAPSPFGDLLVATSRRGLVRVAFPHEGIDDVLQELADLVSPRVLEAPAMTDEARRELEEYFERQRRRFEVPVDMALTRGFTRKVLRATARIPFGSVSTYKEMAKRAGNVRAYRAAGNALGSNPIPIVVPCHRVLHTGGGLGGYGGGLDKKQFLLELEGALP